jgi:general secretion pathway protein D
LSAAFVSAHFTAWFAAPITSKDLYCMLRIPMFKLVMSLSSALLLLCGCASAVIDEAEHLSRTGRYEEALSKLDEALRARPNDPVLRTAHSRERERVLVQALVQADLARSAGRLNEAERLLERVRALDPQQARAATLARELSQARRDEAQRAASAAAAAAASSPTTPASSLAPNPASTLGAAFQKPVTLEFRDAQLRQVFEALARGSAVNFVFDKDVRADAKVTVFLRGVTLDEAVRVILSTQQLDRKVLNDSTVLIYPNTAAKQREHQELVTRSLYLVNADVKQALAMVRTMAKTRDLHADERLNALVIRDTPEVVALVEQLLASIDQPDPEVMLAVEVLEVASDKLDELGINWPDRVEFGIPGLAGNVTLNRSGEFRTSVLNPALAATLRGNSGATNLLANPTIRARNREKAKVQIGEKLPVFSTTAALNVGVSTTVTYIDVGLKLDVEPTVQLDGDVTIKVALEVSNLLREVAGPGGSLAYQVGTRLTTTSLRLKDGETQALAGLIKDEDRQRANGLPGLSRMPLLGSLFGVRSDSRNKTEIVMLITPRIVRNVSAPDPNAPAVAAGTDSLPGAPALRLRASARAGVGPARGGSAGSLASSTVDTNTDAQAQALAASSLGLLLASTAEARVGGTVSVTLNNRSSQRSVGELQFDANLLRPAAMAAAAIAASPGRVPYQLEPKAETVVIFRVLPAAAGQSVNVQASADQPVEGAAVVRIAPAEVPQ